MLDKIIRAGVLFILTLALSACYYSHPHKGDTWNTPNENGIDSTSFSSCHHYWVGYNFQAVDSLTLLTAPPISDLPDYGAIPNESVRIGKRDEIVVARIMYAARDTTDSVWVKVAHDQLTQGWIPEHELLQHVVPNDPISKFIYNFSGGRTTVVFSLLGLALLLWLFQRIRHKPGRIVHFRDIPSFYPTLLCLCVSGSATLYGSMQRFVPGTWVEFYYHPSLNPFDTGLPLILSLFIASIWLMLIVSVAVIDEIRRQPDLGDTLSYLSSLGAVCIVLYLVFTLSTPLYIGYPLLIAYWAFAIHRYIKNQPSHLICGVCGKSIPHKGICPHCGAINE